MFIVLHVMYQICYFAFFTTLNSDCNSRVTEAEILTCFHRKNCCEKGVPIIWRSASVESIVNYNWICRMSSPTIAIRLLVHMSIHKHLLLRCWFALRAGKSLYINDQKWRSTLIFYLFDHDTLDIASLCKFSEMSHLLEKIPVDLPVFIEDGRKTLNLDELYLVKQVDYSWALRGTRCRSVCARSVWCPCRVLLPWSELN